ncbi:MAG: MetQ/NlpA family ABC transporter substrate-binding protein [Yaniella sp.]|nr:MetQ/NlpA family ABC transporter substrate-binding protein [Yaniella sp.]
MISLCNVQRTFRAPKRLLLGSLAAASILTLSACGLAERDEQRISMILTESGPFQEPTEIAKAKREAAGWTLATTYVTDIVQPNQVVANEEYDVNYFQHLAYLRQFNDDYDLDVEPLFAVFQAPAGLYSEHHDTLEDLPQGAQIALPVDRANNGRGLLLLHEAGLLEIDDSKDVTEISQEDIIDNPDDYEFIEVDQQSLAQTLPDVDAGFSFTRLIAESDVDVEATDPLIIEKDAEAQLPFTVVIAAAPGFAENEPEKYEALRDAYQSDEVQEWFDDYIGGLKNTAFDIDVQEIWNDFQEGRGDKEPE